MMKQKEKRKKEKKWKEQSHETKHTLLFIPCPVMLYFFRFSFFPPFRCRCCTVPTNRFSSLPNVLCTRSSFHAQIKSNLPLFRRSQNNTPPFVFVFLSVFLSAAF
jgi:hypothetical protein